MYFATVDMILWCNHHTSHYVTPVIQIVTDIKCIDIYEPVVTNATVLLFEIVLTTVKLTLCKSKSNEPWINSVIAEIKASS